MCSNLKKEINPKTNKPYARCNDCRKSCGKISLKNQIELHSRGICCYCWNGICEINPKTNKYYWYCFACRIKRSNMVNKRRKLARKLLKAS